VENLRSGLNRGPKLPPLKRLELPDASKLRAIDEATVSQVLKIFDLPEPPPPVAPEGNRISIAHGRTMPNGACLLTMDVVRLQTAEVLIVVPHPVCPPPQQTEMRRAPAPVPDTEPVLPPPDGLSVSPPSVAPGVAAPRITDGPGSALGIACRKLETHPAYGIRSLADVRLLAREYNEVVMMAEEIFRVMQGDALDRFWEVRAEVACADEGSTLAPEPAEIADVLNRVLSLRRPSADAGSLAADALQAADRSALQAALIDALLRRCPVLLRRIRHDDPTGLPVRDEDMRIIETALEDAIAEAADARPTDAAFLRDMLAGMQDLFAWIRLADGTDAPPAAHIDPPPLHQAGPRARFTSSETDRRGTRATTVSMDSGETPAMRLTHAQGEHRVRGGLLLTGDACHTSDMLVPLAEIAGRSAHVTAVLHALMRGGATPWKEWRERAQQCGLLSTAASYMDTDMQFLSLCRDGVCRKGFHVLADQWSADPRLRTEQELSPAALAARLGLPECALEGDFAFLELEADTLPSQAGGKAEIVRKLHKRMSADGHNSLWPWWKAREFLAQFGVDLREKQEDGAPHSKAIGPDGAVHTLPSAAVKDREIYVSTLYGLIEHFGLDERIVAWFEAQDAE
jgi:hypothetical protein